MLFAVLCAFWRPVPASEMGTEADMFHAICCFLCILETGRGERNAYRRRPFFMLFAVFCAFWRDAPASEMRTQGDLFMLFAVVLCILETGPGERNAHRR